MHIPRRFVSLAEPSAGDLLTAPDDRATGLAALALLHLSASAADRLGFASLLGSSPFDSRFPGGGRTAELFETLSTVAAFDLGVARTLEPHLDALAILRQAGGGVAAGAGSEPGGSGSVRWGVFAAEGGPDPLLAADEPSSATAAARSWRLNGTKPWCSLADRLDAALVSATLAPSISGGDAVTTAAAVTGAAADAAPVRQLFAVDLRQPGVTALPGAWHARGLSEIPSGPVHFDRVPATPVGAPGWYLTRPGFAWGGIAVAACWFGGAVGLARTLYIAATTTSGPLRAPDTLLAMHLGAVDALLEDCRRALAEAAAAIDGEDATGDAGRLLAKRVRATVARSSEQVLQHVGHALGPAPLALDPGHAKRVADLVLYVRQHHAEKDDASLGAQLAASGAVPW